MSICFSELKYYTVQWPYCARIRCGGTFKCTVPEHNVMRVHTAGQRTMAIADKLPGTDVTCQVVYRNLEMRMCSWGGAIIESTKTIEGGLVLLAVCRPVGGGPKG